MKALTIDQLTVGQSASFSKTISEHDIYEFAGITGDLNPAHINEEYARNTHFRGRIAHGILSAGLISAAIAMQLPGPGSIYLGQTLKFTAPVRIGDTITATVTITELNTGKNRVKLHTVCTNQEGAVVIDGEASVMPPK
ncbi:MaoC family dehydratase [Lawsonibacter celer]|jgi:3-hydroxybutyryl-CoA dehydratase|uniref:MaoC family dehydratase n=1 Tax=Lawsonibacter celer TaxID=2986526 RepID=UPI0016473D9C|nr:MaoC family dehydratase [Lawsonibacter celer]